MHSLSLIVALQSTSYVPIVVMLYTMRKNANAMKNMAVAATHLRNGAGMLFRCRMATTPNANEAMMKIIVADMFNWKGSPLRSTYEEMLSDMFEEKD